MRIQLLTHTKNPELMIATAAKLCYSPSGINDLMEAQTSDQVEKFISRLESLGHESPFEHVSFTFAIEGVSRILEQQLTRHRIASYSIQSGRYVERNNAEFYMPEDIKECEYAKDIYTSLIEDSKEAYQKLTHKLIYHYILTEYSELIPDSILEDSEATHFYFLEKHKKECGALKKRAIENARYVFPGSLETKIIVTMNVRTLWNFLKHRCCNRAQDEIRELAKTMLKLLRAEFPLLFKHAGAACVSGICPENAMQCDQFKGKIPTQTDVKLLIDKYWNKEA